MKNSVAQSNTLRPCRVVSSIGGDWPAFDRRTMTEDLFKLLDPLLDPISAKLQEVLESADFQTVREALLKVSASLPGDVSLTLNCNLEAFDPKRGHSMKLLQIGLTTSKGIPPYTCWGDSTAHRYLVRGTICQVPHNYCPECWGEWDFKDMHRTCPNCGVEMGKDVKILLDSDVCPNCEEGKVGIGQPTCSKCGHTVDLAIVAWG